MDFKPGTKRGYGNRGQTVTEDKIISTSDALLLAADRSTRDVSMSEKIGLHLRPLTSIVVLAWAVRLVSVFNMLNALLRYQPKFIFWLGKWVPFEISEGLRIRMFLMSLLLFILASGLQRGKRLAWQITLAGLLLAPILHLGRGVIWPQALVNLALIAFLLLHRRYFVVESDPRSIRSALIICPLLALALLIFGTIRLHALHKHTLGDHTWPACAQTACELVFVHHTNTQLALTSHSRDLFTVLRVGGTTIALVGLFLILRPVLLRRRTRFEHREMVRKLIVLHGNDPLDPYALLSDKRYFFTASGRGVVPYVLSGNMAIALARSDRSFRRTPAGHLRVRTHFCRYKDWEPVFYEVTEEMLPHYEQAGFSVFKIGEEARLRADEFHLKGRDYQNLRTACNTARKQNIGFRWYDATLGIDEALEDQLAEISRQWLEGKNAREMTFDMGSYCLEDDSPTMSVGRRDRSLRPDALALAATLAALRPGHRPDARPDAVSAQGAQHHGFCPGRVDSPFPQPGRQRYQPGQRAAGQRGKGSPSGSRRRKRRCSSSLKISTAFTAINRFSNSNANTVPSGGGVMSPIGAACICRWSGWRWCGCMRREGSGNFSFRDQGPAQRATKK